MLSKATFMRVMLPYTGPVPMRQSIMPCPELVLTSQSIVLFVHPGRMTWVAPVMRQVTFVMVMLPCPGLGPTSRSTVLSVHPG